MKIKFVLLIICILLLSFANSEDKDLARQNETIAIAFFNAWNSSDVDKLNSMFTDEFKYIEVHSGRSYSDTASFSAYAKGTLSGIPDSKFDVVSVIANDEFASVEWIWKGTNSVGWDFMGIPATRKYFELPGVSIIKIENQKIKRVSDYWDKNSFMEAIGVANR